MVHAHLDQDHGGKMASCSCSHELTIVSQANIWSWHGVKVLIVLIRNEDNSTIPSFLFYKVLNPLFCFGTLVNWDDSSIVINRWSFGRQWCWRRILKDEFLNTFPNILHAELSFLNFIAWSEEDHMTLRVDVMLLSEFSSYLVDCPFHIGAKKFLVNVKWVILKKRFKLLWLAVEMTDCLIDCVLTNVFTRELEAISCSSCERKSEVDKVEVLGCPLFVILDKFVMEMSLWQIICTISIVLYKALTQV